MPPERQGGLGIRRYVRGFARGAPVAVDDEAMEVKLFQVNEAGRGGAGGQRCSRDAHSLGLMYGVAGGGKPDVELGEGGRGKTVAGEGALEILRGAGSGFWAGRGDLGY